MPYKIESGVPLPPPHPEPKYPLRKMAVGQSFFVPASKAARNAPKSIHAQARYIRHACAGFQVTVRKVKGGLRVWRIG